MSTNSGDLGPRLTALEAAHKELQDAFIVMTHLETKMSQMLKEQAEYVANHEKRMQALDARNRDLDARNRDVDERIDKLVSAIGKLISERRQ